MIIFVIGLIITGAANTIRIGSFSSFKVTKLSNS